MYDVLDGDDGNDDITADGDKLNAGAGNDKVDCYHACGQIAPTSCSGSATIRSGSRCMSTTIGL